MKNKLLLVVLGTVLTAQALVAQVPSYVPTNGLVGYWPFNGNANDASGNGNNGTVNGATLTTDRNGNANSAYSFDGVNDLIRIPHQSQLNLLGDFSASIWYNINSIPTTNNGHTFLTKRDDNGICCSPNVPYGLAITYQVSQAPLNYKNPICAFANNGNFNFSTSSTTITSNIWQHIVYTYSNNILKIYLNNEIIHSQAFSNSLRAGNSADLLIGSVNREIGAEWMNGKLDDIGIWNRALTQQEITNLYNASLPQTACLPANVPTSGLVGYWPFCGNTNDESGNANNGTVNGATLTTDRFGNANSAYNFDGVDDRIDVGSLNNSIGNSNSSWSISTWFKSTGSNNDMVIVSDYSSESGGDQIISTWIALWSFTYNNKIGTNIRYFPNGWEVYSLNSYNDNLWHNVVSTMDNGTLKLFIDNQFIASANYPSNTNFNNSPFFRFGALKYNNQYDSFFYGQIDDIGIWNRALTQQEITNLYNANQCLTTITVTDTLIINVGQLSFTNPVTWANNITIAPNPASTEVNINFNTITNLAGGSINIINALGQSVATTPITVSGTNTTLSLATWGGTGMYFVQIINPQGQIVDIKKIILQ